MNRKTLCLRYGFFALLAAAVNLGLQQLIWWFCEDVPYSFEMGVMGGTLAGLGVKYILDKRWIFADTTRGLAQNMHKFSLYSVMSIFTTLLFWGTEYLFYFFDPDLALLGGGLGLLAGYIVKYNLDKRFVFRGQP